MDWSNLPSQLACMVVVRLLWPIIIFLRIHQAPGHVVFLNISGISWLMATEIWWGNIGPEGDFGTVTTTCILEATFFYLSAYCRLDCIDHTALCSEKNTHSHFLSYLHELFVDLNKNCREYIQGLIGPDNVKIIYLLRSMT